MTRRLLRLLSPDSHILRQHQRHRQRGVPSFPVITGAPSSAPSNRSFCSQAAGDAKSEDPFAPFKCYTRRDPETPPYYVIQPPASSFAPRWPLGRVAVPDELLARWNIQHLVRKSRGPEGHTTSHHVYLVGVGPDEKSVDEIKDIMGCLKPEVLFLELCANRRLLLALEKVQGNKWVQVQHHVSHVAFEEAICNGAKVVLGDRPFDITVRRVLQGMLAMPIMEFTKLSFSLLFHFMEYGKDNKNFNINDFIHQKLKDLVVFPTLLQPAIHERDLYMSSVLSKVVEENNSVVAIVGTDHVAGIKNNWEQIDHQVKARVSETSD